MSEIYQLNDYIYCVPFTYNNNSYRICINILTDEMFIQQITDDLCIDDITLDNIINDRVCYNA